MKKLLSRALIVTAFVAAPSFASIDTASAVEQIGLINGAVIAVGGALIAAAATAVSVKWVKAAIFG